ncbi:MAG TPA: translation initiation factor [Opitutaceae bacterium]|nr:translation initiation factor [Opitutaceae bacterium]
MKGNKISTEGGDELRQNPFGALSNLGLPNQPAPAGGQNRSPNSVANGSAATGGASAGGAEAKRKDRGRVDILREKAGRGGKTVTVAAGFVGIGLPEKEMLAKKMQKACGVGGTVKDGRIEIQGDKRDEVARILTEAGFRPVFAGG